jgi:hypothetical protein
MLEKKLQKKGFQRRHIGGTTFYDFVKYLIFKVKIGHMVSPQGLEPRSAA